MAIPSGLSQSLRHVLGNEAAGDLMSWMDNVESMRSDTTAVRIEMAEMRGQFAEMRGEFAEFREAMRADFAEFRHEVNSGFSELRVEIAQTRADLMKWSFVFWIGSVAAIAALAGILK